MENFRKKFLEEAFEHIADLEQSLLALEQDTENPEIVEQVFRAMHSLKGGGAMFGLENVSSFTHDLETIYDLVRNNEMEISKELLNVTLQSVDHLKVLLENDDAMDEDLEQEHEVLIQQIKQFIVDKKVAKIEDSNSTSSSNAVTNTSKDKTYYILFKPREDILNNGTNPLYLIEELTELGKTIVFPHFNKLPDLKELQPEKCYCYWEIILATSADVNSINDVFIFVEDDSEIEIQKIHDENLVENKTFNRRLKKHFETLDDQDIGISECMNLANLVKSSVASKVKKAIHDKNHTVTKEQISSIRVASSKLDELMNLVSELVTTQARLSLLAEQETIPELSGIAENIQKLTRQLRDNAFSIVLIPIENMLTRFQRLVRDLSSELKKEVKFIATGTDTELDKTIIENLTDPLLHILRNSLDHGIELPEEREKIGKPREGTIELKAFYSGASVYIQISDDGRGINHEYLKQKAIDKGIISADITLTEKELLDLIFLPGFSTVSKVTDVSGRGVGMDVVKRKISDIRGEIEIDTKKDKGTTLTIKLPLTLSIIDGLLVKIDNEHYVIPLTAVDKIYACEHETLMKSYNNVIVFDGQQIPYFYLRNEFGLPELTGVTEEVVVVRFEDKKVGLTVDSVEGECQAVLKPLGKHYKKQELISGATILGDGTIALVMDTNKAIKQFSKRAAINYQQTSVTNEE